MVGLDPNPSHRWALDWAADEADRRGLPLRIVYAQGLPTVRVTQADLLPSWEQWNRSLHEAGELALGDAVAYVEDRHPQLMVTVELAEGEPSWVLREQAPEASLIVLGSRRLSTGRELFTSASVALPVIAHAPCPVVVVREPEHTAGEPPHFVVGVDGSAEAAGALDFAFAEAALRGASLRAVSVWHPAFLRNRDERAGHEAMLEAELTQLVSEREAAYPAVKAGHEVVLGHPVHVLGEESARALGIVVGTRGLGGFTGMLLGSVSQGVLHHARCPVITVPLAGKRRAEA
ncbi:universal stress protein [Streptomyces sp. RB6PN25]|uniref:Universal stress protein n=1 Tax=Streptomyces humicola TaxID=2953240 RepID=A0ABT1PWK4_9ACTN|nr:universal stress protein [Streptomyces humicola]